MKLQLLKVLGNINKAVLPKVWNTADLSNLSTSEKAILGWKRWVTLKYLEEKEKKEKAS
ncbi:MAG: SsrA-binding protein [Schleiferiaceae bacterium]|jgi:hypothetical protein|nr:SsrA-binding protein [Schleiferiaceae bacterium]